jgi:hypothetical protein
MNAAEARFNPALKLATRGQFAAYLAGERVYPIGLEVSPSGVCNASCEFCWYAHDAEHGHRKVFLDAGRLAEILAEAADLGVKAVSWTGGGEPSLHPQIGKLVSLTHALGLKQGMFTNALAHPHFDPSLLEWARVTMTDRPPKPDCIRALRPARALGFAFNYAGPQDDAYLEETLRLAESVGADYLQVRPALKFHGETVDIEPPAIRHPLLYVTDYKFADARKPHGYDRCEGYAFCPFLWEDGNLDVCAYNRRHDGYTLGNVYHDGLKAILDRAPASVPVHAGCQVACKLHQTNQAIHAARAVEDREFP